jgi:hypothetical protein
VELAHVAPLKKPTPFGSDCGFQVRPPLSVANSTTAPAEVAPVTQQSALVAHVTLLTEVRAGNVFCVIQGCEVVAGVALAVVAVAAVVVAAAPAGEAPPLWAAAAAPTGLTTRPVNPASRQLTTIPTQRQLRRGAVISAPVIRRDRPGDFPG